MKTLTALVLLCFSGVCLGMTEDQLENAAIEGARRIKDNLKKPETFEITKVVYLEPTTLCYEYRARNSFNDVTRGHYVIGAKVSSDKGEAWNKHCANKRGTDYPTIVRGNVK